MQHDGDFPTLGAAAAAPRRAGSGAAAAPAQPRSWAAKTTPPPGLQPAAAGSVSAPLTRSNGNSLGGFGRGGTVRTMQFHDAAP